MNIVVLNCIFLQWVKSNNCIEIFDFNVFFKFQLIVLIKNWCSCFFIFMHCDSRVSLFKWVGWLRLCWHGLGATSKRIYVLSWCLLERELIFFFGNFQYFRDNFTAIDYFTFVSFLNDPLFYLNVNFRMIFWTRIFIY